MFVKIILNAITFIQRRKILRLYNQVKIIFLVPKSKILLT